MPESVKERLAADLQKAKSEGQMRAERIKGIVKNAFSQTIAEVKEGSGEIFKHQTVNFVTNLTERYGDRYVAIKQRLQKVAAWYNNVTAQAKTIEPNVLQHRQAEFENKLGEAGATLAQKERQIKQQLKNRWTTIAAKF